MQDLLKSAESWFEAQRREHLAATVEYRPKTGLARQCAATLVVGRWEAVDRAGNVVRIETRDFLIHRDDLLQDPVRGDEIVVDEGGVEKTYEVCVPDGAQNPWRWSDRSETLRRIHAMAKSGATAVPNSTLLVRAVGVSAAASINEQQIKSQLTLDLSQQRSLQRQLVASGQYVYVVLPASFGDPVFRANGFTTTAWESSTMTLAFDGQSARPYRVYRSTYAVTGHVHLEVE